MPPKKAASKQQESVKKTQKKSKPAPAEEDKVVEDPVEDSTDEEQTSEDGTQKKTTIPKFKFDGDLEDVEAQIKEMKDRMNEMQKQMQHEMTIYKHYLDDLSRYTLRLRKEQDKQVVKKQNRKKVERTVPMSDISDELAEFMDKEHGSQAARTEALSCISTYAKEHKLSGVEVKGDDGVKKMDNRMIRMDDKLGKLFPDFVDSKEYLTYATILKHIGPHFKKKDTST